jgi:DNA repair exonuclease SbcCD ATPase subunit
MKPPKSRITQLGKLVERLAEQLSTKFGPAGLVHLEAMDPYGFELEGRSLRRWVKEIWPGLPPLTGPVLGQEAVQELCDSRKQSIDALKKRLDSADQEIQSAGQRLDEERGKPQIQLQEARVYLSRIERNIGDLRSRKKQLLGAASRQEKEIRELKKWLEGLKPKGMKGFRDLTGRPVSSGEIKANTAKLASLQEAVKLNRDEARHLSQKIATAQETRSQALEQIKTLDDARQRAEKALIMQAADLKKEKQKLALKRRDMDGLNRALSRSQALHKLHEEILSQASELLLPLLMEPEPRADEVPAAEMQKCLELAETARKRADRLGALLQLQTDRLEPLIAGMGQISGRVRSVNKDIQKLEKELPGLLMPLMQPGGEPGGNRRTPPCWLDGSSRAWVPISMWKGSASAAIPASASSWSTMPPASMPRTS